MTRDPLLSGRPDEDSVALLSGYSEAGLISVTGDVDKRADMALDRVPVASGLGRPTQRTPHSRTSCRSPRPSMTPVMASSSWGRSVRAENGGYVTSVRGDHDSRRAVSTVDAADLASGRIATILALVEQFQAGSGTTAHGPGATDTLPRLTPDGVPSPTPTPSKSTTKPSKSASSKPSHSSSASP